MVLRAIAWLALKTSLEFWTILLQYKILSLFLAKSFLFLQLSKTQLSPHKLEAPFRMLMCWDNREEISLFRVLFRVSLIKKAKDKSTAKCYKKAFVIILFILLLCRTITTFDEDAWVIGLEIEAFRKLRTVNQSEEAFDWKSPLH